MTDNIVSQEYGLLLSELKSRVQASRHKATLSVNKELILLYHHIGSQILAVQERHSWGAKIVDQLSIDLRSEFPDMKGFGTANLHNMRRFAETYADLTIVQQLAGQLPWYHHVTLMERVKDHDTRMFYIRNAAQYGWSRATLLHHIDLRLHERQGKAVTNFKDRLPAQQSDLAHSILKDPYIFDFLSIGPEAHEREIEKALIHHVQKFLLELGEGFAFVGRQYHLEVAGKDFYIDLLFYHLKLRCFVVVELKDQEFKPEYAGKMNFYLSAVDDLIRHASDQPSIGLIMCRTKDNVLAEYALRDMAKPIGLTEYNLTKVLPKDLETALPTIQELEAALTKMPV